MLPAEDIYKATSVPHPPVWILISLMPSLPSVLSCPEPSCCSSSMWKVRPVGQQIPEMSHGIVMHTHTHVKYLFVEKQGTMTDKWMNPRIRLSS